MIRSRLRPPPVWAVVVVLTSASLGLAPIFLRDTGPASDAIAIPWPLLLVAFALAEAAVVHLQFRSEAVTFSFVEFPLVLGALFTPAIEVWAALVVGTAISLFILRRQALIKAAFNTANLALQAAVALVIFHSIIGSADPLGPPGWLAASIATVLSGILNVGAFTMVLWKIEGRIDIPKIGQTLFLSELTSMTNVALALVAASLADYRPTSLLLLIPPTVVLFIANQAFVNERAHRERIEHMHDATSEIRAMRDLSAIPAVLSGTADRLRARRVVLVLLPTDPDEPATRYTVDATTTTVAELSERQTSLALSLARQTDAPHIVSDPCPAQVVDVLEYSATSGLAGTVHGDGAPIGLLYASDRLGDLTDFVEEDLELLTATVKQLGLALENNQLGQTISELARLEREMSYAAQHDALTGCANRTLMTQVLHEALRDGDSVSLLYLDLDDFKQVNDTLGHDTGDQVLVEASRRIAAAVRPVDCVARLGGDEFVAVLIDCDDDHGAAQRVVNSFAEPFMLSTGGRQIGVSIGLARARPGEAAVNLLANADRAMYEAKRNKISSFEFFQQASESSDAG